MPGPSEATDVSRWQGWHGAHNSSFILRFAPLPMVANLPMVSEWPSGDRVGAGRLKCNRLD